MKLLARFQALPWPQKLSLAALLGAAASFVQGGLVSSVCYLVAAFMGWTPFFVANAASGKRTMGAKGRLVAGGIMVAVAVIMLPKSSPAVSEGGRNAGGDATDTRAEVATSDQCDFGSRKTGVDFVAKTDVDLRVMPKTSAATVQWKIGDESIAYPMEEGRTVREHCRVDNWSKIHVPTSNDVPRLYGWVPSSELREVPTISDGRRSYAIGDFDWPQGRAADRAAAVAVMNRIMKERTECEALDHGSLVLNKTSKGEEFSVPCFADGEMLSFDFTARDATNGRSFAKVDPIKENDAVSACSGAFLGRATHPSTVEFPVGYEFKSGGEGQTEILMKASAKNGFNLQLTYNVHCGFNGAKLVDFSMSETAG